MQAIGYNPYTIKVSKGGDFVGYIIGSYGRIKGVRAGAPIEGVNTCCQGLVSGQKLTSVERIEIYRQLAQWMFAKRKCLRLSVVDWQLREELEGFPTEAYRNELLENVGIQYSGWLTIYTDMHDLTHDELWAKMAYKSCKYCVNKARKSGLYVKEITKEEEIDDFVREHHAQLTEVCERKGKKPRPGQSPDKMKAVIRALMPDRVIVLEVCGKDEEGEEQIMSTGIFCIEPHMSVYWTGASWQKYQKYCPNELMVWEALERMQAKGVQAFNLCGGHPYKMKFGGQYAIVPRLIFTKYKIVDKAYKWMKDSIIFLRKLLLRVVSRERLLRLLRKHLYLREGQTDAIRLLNLG